MIHAIRNILAQLIDDLDAGNTYLSESEMMDIMDLFNRLNNRNTMMNRTEAAEYLHMSQRSFDRYVHDGVIPKGEHHRGDKQILWRRADLDKVKL